MILGKDQKNAIKAQLTVYAQNKEDSKASNRTNTDIVNDIALRYELDKKAVRKAFNEMIKIMDTGDNSLDEAQEIIEQLRD